jgi:hypothetical protein
MAHFGQLMASLSKAPPPSPSSRVSDGDRMLSGKRVAEGGVSSLGLDPGVGKPLVGLFCVTRAELQTSSV